jgi:hypothetical protein
VDMNTLRRSDVEAAVADPQGLERPGGDFATFCQSEYPVLVGMVLTRECYAAAHVASMATEPEK